MSIFRFSAEFRFFGVLPLFFKWFSAFFLKNLLKKKTTGLRHRHYWESSNSFGKQSLTSSFAAVRFFRFRSKFESVVSTLGTVAGCGLTKRRRWCLNSRSFWPLTCYFLPREGEERVVLKWRDRGRLEGIAGVLSWPVHFAHLIPAFGQNDREEACVVCQVCTFMCPGNELSPPPPPPSTQAVFHSPFSPKHTCRVSLSHTGLSLSLCLSVCLSLSLSPSLSHTHTHTHAIHGSCLSSWCLLSLSLSLSLTYTHRGWGTT